MNKYNYVIENTVLEISKFTEIKNTEYISCSIKKTELVDIIGCKFTNCAFYGEIRTNFINCEFNNCTFENCVIDAEFCNCEINNPYFKNTKIWLMVITDCKFNISELMSVFKKCEYMYIFFEDCNIDTNVISMLSTNPEFIGKGVNSESGYSSSVIRFDDCRMSKTLFSKLQNSEHIIVFEGVRFN